MRAFFAVFLALGAIAAPHKRDTYAVKDKHHVPAPWKQLDRASKDHTISLRIGLKQGAFDELDRHLNEVSDPDHEHYGKHLSNEEVSALVAPSAASLAAVHSWLEDNDIRLDQLDYSSARDWIVVSLRVSEVESLLDTQYHVYENAEKTRMVRTPQYSLPRALHAHIDVIQPTNYFGDIKAMGRPFWSEETDRDYIPKGYDWEHPKPANLSAVCNSSAVTNLCLRTLYNTVNYVPQVPTVNTVAMTAYLNETANISDFHIFLSRQRQDASLSYTFNYTTIANGIDFQGLETTFFGQRDVEANLDSQTIGGFVYPTDFRVYSTGGSPPFNPDLATPTDTNEPYMVWLNYMLTLENPPHVISTSYGDDEQTVPFSYATRVCQEFAQLGAKGVTLLFSSGDNGVGPNGTCFSNDGLNKTEFLPSFPPSCPYITTVGGTRNIQPEIVAYDVRNGYVSGSGISNYFARPAYQKSAVQSYLNSIGSLHAGLYNTTGRAYPDIAAQGYHYIIVYAGKNVSVDGTSCSAPTAAGVLANVNDALIAEGKPPLGFLNPALYKGLYKGFNDITIGNTYGCDTSGFPAKTGWDLASGFGTPDFLKIKEIAVEGGHGYGGYDG